jgi:hypothetical protein
MTVARIQSDLRSSLDGHTYNDSRSKLLDLRLLAGHPVPTLCVESASAALSAGIASLIAARERTMVASFMLGAWMKYVGYRMLRKL